ncbi:MAG: hypothetical protein Q7N50_08295 [Armatimonadota bacterium]|nr:hypothetical protein [Armatimonadota bacterium]
MKTEQSILRDKPHWKRADYMIRFLTLYGFVGWIAAFLVGIGVLNIPNNVELALADVQSIVADSHGHIYCDSAMYGRIQVYDASGKFLWAWDYPYKHSSITIDKKDRLHVFSGKEFVLSQDGRLLKERPSIKEYDYSSDYSSYRDMRGNVYKLHTPTLYPRVIKTDPSGREKTVVSVPFYLWLTGPIFAFLCLIIACMYGYVISVIRRRAGQDIRNWPWQK